MSLGHSQAVRQQTLTLSSRGFKSRCPNQNTPGCHAGACQGGCTYYEGNPFEKGFSLKKYTLPASTGVSGGLNLFNLLRTSNYLMMLY